MAQYGNEFKEPEKDLGRKEDALAETVPKEGQEMTSAERPRVYGAPYSVYVRAVRLALEEKGVAYDLVPVDIFANGGPPADYLARHPFGKIPAFEHAGFSLYEAEAITRYVDEAFPGPRLQPEDIRARARMTQIMSILDSYVYRTLIWDIYVECVARPARGILADERKVAAALPKAEICLRALSDVMAGSPWLAGATLTLADLHAAPMMDLFSGCPQAPDLLAREPDLIRWWDQLRTRPSLERTEVSIVT